MLYGALGEIVTEKSGNLNLGVPGVMYMGGIAGLMGAFFTKTETGLNGFVGLVISFLCAFLAGILGGLIYSILTITLRANQNVTGLALTTFGTGFGNFFGVPSLRWLAVWVRSQLPPLELLTQRRSLTQQDPGDRTGSVFLRIHDISLHHPGMCVGVLPLKDEKRTEPSRRR